MFEERKNECIKKRSRCSTRKKLIESKCKPNSHFLISMYDQQPSVKKFERNLHSRQQNRGIKITEKSLDFELEHKHKRPFTAKNKPKNNRLTSDRFWIGFKGHEYQSINIEKSIKSKFSKPTTKGYNRLFKRNFINLKSKDISASEKSYLQRKRAILDKIEFEQKLNKWPAEMKDPKHFKSFYWAPDLSFCGFASSKEIRKLNSISIQKNRSSYVL